MFVILLILHNNLGGGYYYSPVCLFFFSPEGETEAQVGLCNLVEMVTSGIRLPMEAV